MYKKMMQTLSESEKELTEKLKSDELSQFQSFPDAWSYINSETNRESFKTGFKFGIKCMIDVFNN